jgi:hypothetical protein
MSCGGSMKKMAVGGTTTKRIIKKSTGGMYGIPQENLGTSGQYGFAKKGGATKPLIKAQKGKIVKTSTPFQNYMKTPGAIASDTTESFTGSRNSSKPVLDKAYYDTYYAGRENERRTGNDKVKYDANGKRVYKKGGATKAAKFAALAPPYDKATFADRIVGAKKSVGSKKLPKAQLGAIVKGIMGFKTAYKASKIVKQAAKKGNFKDWHNEMDILLKKSNPNIKKYIDKETVIKNFKKVIKSKPGDTYKSAVNLKSISPKPKNTYKSAVNLKNTSKVKVNAKNKK